MLKLGAKFFDGCHNFVVFVAFIGSHECPFGQFVFDESENF